MGVVKSAKTSLGIGTKRYSHGTHLDVLTWIVSDKKTKDLSVAIKRAEQAQKEHPSERIFVIASDTLYGFKYADGTTISSAKALLKKQQLKKKAKMKKSKKYWK